MRSLLKPPAQFLGQIIAPDVIHRLEQLKDWPQLSVYRAKNEALEPPKPDSHRVLFFGDSITEFWNLAESFPHQDYINRGIAGQTTPQLLVRFRPDVIALRPKVVLILAGINDLAGNTGPMTLDMITDNYASMGDLAQANAIQVIFASVLPIHDYGKVKQSTVRPPTQVKALNNWLCHYCHQHNHIYLDYYNALVDAAGNLNHDLSDDGVHPNAQGYRVMTPLAQHAIEQALSRI